MSTRIIIFAPFLALAACRAGGTPSNSPQDVSGIPNQPSSVPPDQMAATPGPGDGTAPSGATHHAAYGLETRPANAHCKAPARPSAAAEGDLALVPFFPNLKFGTSWSNAAMMLLRQRIELNGAMK